MGWCSATEIFDAVAEHVAGKPKKKGTRCIAKKLTPKDEDLLEVLYDKLTDGDWDCQHDSEYYCDPRFKGVFQLDEESEEWCKERGQ